MRARFLPTAALVLVLGTASAAAAVTVTLLSGGGRSAAGDGVMGDSYTVVSFGALPYSSGPVTAMDGGGVSTTEHTFTHESLLIEFTHARPGNPSGVYVWSDDYAPGSGVTFRVSEPVVVRLSGAYDVADTGAGDNAWYDVRLYGNGFSTLLHQTYNYSNTTPNESFVVGQAGGDSANSITGDTIHVLVPGVTYAIEWYTGIQDGHLDPGDIGASATGYYRVAFLPEPSSELMLTAGLVVLGVLARRVPTCAATPRRRR